MNHSFLLALGVLLFSLHTPVQAQKLTSNIPYVPGGDSKQVLDVYSPEPPFSRKLPVVFWIHGGGWQTGDKSDVGIKPKVLTAKGFVFVSTNYRLLPAVDMDVLTRDVATSLGWVHHHIADYGGDPNRIFVGGHSAGAQLAALICTDERYAAEHSVSLKTIRGCIAVDGDTYDIPKIIMTAEHRQLLYGGAMFRFGHRQKFGNDPVKHSDFSAVNHVAPGKDIPPFLLLYFPGNPDTQAQAQRLETVLQNTKIAVTAFGKSDTNHNRLNDELGTPNDPATAEFFKFLDSHVEHE